MILGRLQMALLESWRHPRVLPIFSRCTQPLYWWLCTHNYMARRYAYHDIQFTMTHWDIHTQILNSQWHTDICTPRYRIHDMHCCAITQHPQDVTLRYTHPRLQFHSMHLRLRFHRMPLRDVTLRFTHLRWWFHSMRVHYVTLRYMHLRLRFHSMHLRDVKLRYTPAMMIPQHAPSLCHTHPNWNELNLRVLMPLILRLRMEVSWTFLFNVKTRTSIMEWVIWKPKLNIYWVLEWVQWRPIEYTLSVRMGQADAHWIFIECQ